MKRENKTSRDRRCLEAGSYYHIYNRGNHKDLIRLDEEDLATYIHFILNSFEHYEEELLCYCLMPNHYHLLAKVKDPKTFSKAVQHGMSKCARYFNKKYETVGHLFQDKYKHRKINDLTDLIFVSKYIHTNPLKDGICEDFESLLKYPFSSLIDYAGKDFEVDKKSRVHKKDIMDNFFSNEEYIQFLRANTLVEHVKPVANPTFQTEIITKLLNSSNPF